MLQLLLAFATGITMVCCVTAPEEKLASRIFGELVMDASRAGA
jgi:hypothetical protein